MIALLAPLREPINNDDITAGMDSIDKLPPEMAVDILKCIAKGSFNLENAIQLVAEDLQGLRVHIKE